MLKAENAADDWLLQMQKNEFHKRNFYEATKEYIEWADSVIDKNEGMPNEIKFDADARSDLKFWKKVCKKTEKCV